MKTCTVIENGRSCRTKFIARGMCVKHYNRWKKHGDPLKVHAVHEKREHEKWCPQCKDWVSKSDFPATKRNKDGLSTRCSPCQADEHIRAKYNLTRDQWNQMLADQGGGCASCGTTDDLGGYGKVFNVDHDHACCPGQRSCGECVRGLLCDACNRGIGFFRDDPDRLLAAAAYLISHSKIPTQKGSTAV